MIILEWLQFIVGMILLLVGMFLFAVQIIGVYKFDYILNRMHAAAMGDTLGIGVSLLGLIVLSGWSFASLKMLLILVFLWCASPVASHLIARLEATTNMRVSEYCDLQDGVQELLLEDEQKEILAKGKTEEDLLPAEEEKDQTEGKREV